MAIGSGEISKREGLLVAAAFLFLGLIALYWYVPHTAFQQKLADLEGRVEQLDRVNNRAAADIANGGVQELEREAESYTQMFVVLRQLVPQTNEVPTLLEQVSTAARREGLELAGIKPEPTISGPEFDTYRYKVSVTGGFHSIARFLTNVGSLSRVVTPVNVTLRDFSDRSSGAPTATGNALGSTTGKVSAEFEIRTYVAHSASADSAMTQGGM